MPHALHSALRPRAGESVRDLGVGRLARPPAGLSYPLEAEFLDPAAKLAQMDERRIDVSLLSLAPTLFCYDAPADEAVDYVRRSNGALAELVDGK